MSKKLLLGNEAVARGVYEAGAAVVSSYPGTPSTEITEAVSKYDEVYSEWAPNEKVAVETSLGASIGGARAFSAMKHVGLNVAADPLFTASYTGINGGFVIAVADDPGMFSSQNEQDSRHYAEASKVMMLEPSDSRECKDFVKKAFDLSEKFDTPVLLRLTMRVSHSRGVVELEDRKEVSLKEYKKDPSKYVMMPAYAIPKHKVVETRQAAIKEFMETSDLNRVEMNSDEIGVITAGNCYNYAKEALGDKASYLKLGCVYPLPDKLILDFASKCKKIYVVEELDPFIENHCKQLGLKVYGKDKFTMLGEYSQALVAKAVLGEEKEYKTVDVDIPGRPPVLCPGCPHRGVFYALKNLKVTVCGDIGCYTLGALPPLGAMDTTICMGASISSLHGRIKANPEYAKNSVAVIGDSTFCHSGITGLVDITYNNSPATVIVLDNSTTGMTGHQENPTTGKNIKGEPATAIDIVALAKAIGFKRIQVVDPYNLKETQDAIKTELQADEPSLIIARRPCALLKFVKHDPPYKIEQDKCKGCTSCMKIGCPAISFSDKKAHIDATQCAGCGVCTELCHFDAIKGGKTE
jgi:indolepyruvate ferredoxin oxidoreductase alpha subunit